MTSVSVSDNMIMHVLLTISIVLVLLLVVLLVFILVLALVLVLLSLLSLVLLLLVVVVVLPRLIRHDLALEGANHRKVHADAALGARDRSRCTFRVRAIYI